MWELICHHTYKCGGLPVDLSACNSHGHAVNVNVLADGVVPESGALRFNQSGSRVLVPVSAAWQPLGGIMVEVTARVLTQAPHWQMLIAADGAFSFFLREHILFATFTTPAGLSTWPLTGTLATTDGISSAQGLFTPINFPTYSIPIGEWATYGFMHNGLDAMELFVNGQLIGKRTMLQAGVPGVGPGGVSIGNSADNDTSSWMVTLMRSRCGDSTQILCRKTSLPDPTTRRLQIVGNNSSVECKMRLRVTPTAQTSVASLNR